MKTKLLTALATLLLLSIFSPPAHAAQRRTLTAAQTGLDGDALSGGATSDTINMGEKFWGLTLNFQVTVTPGTTISIVASCEESVDGAVWVWIMGCTSAVASTCSLQTLTHDVATIASFSFLIERVRAPFMRCTFEDLAAGDGTISATATVGAP